MMDIAKKSLCFAALSFVAACSGESAWEEEPDTTLDERTLAGAGVGAAAVEESAGGATIGQAQLAQIDARSGTGCFRQVPPFVQAGDAFVLEAGNGFIPTSNCSDGAHYFFMVKNLVKDLGLPFANAANAAVERCADLTLSFAVGLYPEEGGAPEIIATGSKRGVVEVDARGTAQCAVGLSMVPRDLDDMPDGRDYIFVAEVLADDDVSGFSEEVFITNR